MRQAEMLRVKSALSDWTKFSAVCAMTAINSVHSIAF